MNTVVLIDPFPFRMQIFYSLSLRTAVCRHVTVSQPLARHVKTKSARPGKDKQQRNRQEHCMRLHPTAGAKNQPRTSQGKTQWAWLDARGAETCLGGTTRSIRRAPSPKLAPSNQSDAREQARRLLELRRGGPRKGADSGSS